MKPHIICHMASSVDGRILPSRWRPQNSGADLFERLHQQLGGQAWLVGRVTGQEFAKAKKYPANAVGVFPREPWFATRDATAYGVVLDANGRIAWGRTGRHVTDARATETWPKCSGRRGRSPRRRFW